MDKRLIYFIISRSFVVFRGEKTKIIIISQWQN